MFGRLFSSDAIGKDFGLLVLRLGIGGSVAILHGYGKITGGPELWGKIGVNMGHMHIAAFPVFWGFMSAFAEFVCSILLILGPLFRLATLMLAFNMLVAMSFHLNLPVGQMMSGWAGASHAFDLLLVYAAMFFTGPGRFAFKLSRSK